MTSLKLGTHTDSADVTVTPRTRNGGVSPMVKIGEIEASRIVSKNDESTLNSGGAEGADATRKGSVVVLLNCNTEAAGTATASE